MVSDELGVDSIMYFSINVSIAQLMAVWIQGFSSDTENELRLRGSDVGWHTALKTPKFTIAILFNFPNLYVRLYWIRDIKDSIYSRSIVPQFASSRIARISLPNMVNWSLPLGAEQ